VRSELFHYEVRATYDTPEVSENRRIVADATDNPDNPWQKTEWTPDEDDEPELPFATTIGSSAALSDAFAVSGISAEKGTSEAFVAFVPSDGKPGHKVSLGRVHGDPDPPLIAPDRDGLLVALDTTDAAGRVLAIYRLLPKKDERKQLFEFTSVGEGGAALAANGDRGVVVFRPAKGKATTLRSASMTLTQPALGKATDLPGTDDAESPLLRPRPGGFWLAWIAQRPAPDAGTRDTDASGEETRPLDAGPRVLTVALLDAEGAPSGAARPVSAEASHVVAFDAQTLHDGALALAWREDDSVPGVETGGPELARVAPDGSVTRGRAADEALGAGAPALVAETGAAPRTWLLVPGEDDRLRMALLAPNAVSTSPFIADDSLLGSEIIAAAPGKRCSTPGCSLFLLARSKNRAVELSVAECRP